MDRETGIAFEVRLAVDCGLYWTEVTVVDVNGTPVVKIDNGRTEG